MGLRDAAWTRMSTSCGDETNGLGTSFCTESASTSDPDLEKQTAFMVVPEGCFGIEGVMVMVDEKPE